MKNLKFLLLLLVTITSISSFGDIIITKSFPNRICVKVNNLNDFPDIAVIGVSECLAPFTKDQVDIIDSISCLNINKLYPFTFYAVKKAYLEKKGINNINWKKDKNVKKSNVAINPDDFKHVDWNAKIDVVELHLDIAGYDKDEAAFIFYLSKRIVKYDRNIPDDVKTYNFEGDFSKLKKSF